jgi:DNA-binding ferritin-like protein
LLQEVYEYLSTAHDDLNEQCRQMGNMCMTSLKEYAEESNFTLDNKAKTDKAMLDDLTKALDSIHMSAQILYTEAGAEGHGALETFIGDYMTGVSKLHWKVKSCLS